MFVPINLQKGWLKMTFDVEMFISILIVAIFVPLVVEGIKKPLPKEWQKPFGVVASLVLSIAICILASLDLFLAFGINLAGIIGTIAAEVMTGACCSLGANKLYDKFREILSYKEKVETDLKEGVADVTGKE